MRRPTAFPLSVLAATWLAGGVSLAPAARAQSGTGALEITARVTPTAARPEPVREFTFYILTKSYADIGKEVEATDVLPTRDEFIDGLKVSPELKTWLKGHEVLDLSTPDLDKSVTPDDIITIPEFLAAYEHSNSGGVTKGLPRPKFKEADKKDHPEKYEKEKQEYYSALKKFIRANPATVSGIEMELDDVNPQRNWAMLHSKHAKRIQKMTPEIAQARYLAAKVDTDLDGHALISGLAPGNYWISSLDLDANAGDSRVRWDVPITIQAGRNLRIELTNLNATDSLAYSQP
ncbi:MAG TPA: hypothetical protein VE077_05705 [Candidatus Methylomirabilis sp.]|nr:hypothetical protein [Candidatus Methylomirabilis sp.]